MALEFEEQVLVFGKFGEAAVGGTLDWRLHKKDEILQRIPLVMVDQHFDALPYRALVSSQAVIDFREAWESEGGTDNPDCCPSYASADTQLCDFKLPELQNVSIGVRPKCYQDWRKEFWRRYPIYNKFSPFRVNGGQVQIIERDSPERNAFLKMANSELSHAISVHLETTAWSGQDAKVDQFNGITYYLENGISTLQVGEGCDYPTTPTSIDLALYIHGEAEALAGTLAGWGDVVLAPDDVNRPADAPADNIITIHAGTSFETTLDITGMDAIDILTAWYEYVTNEWGVDVLEWMLGVPRNGTKCPATVAACKQACAGGDCRSILTGDSRDEDRANREAMYIRERSLRLYPYEETLIPMRQSEALRQQNRAIFIPERFLDGEGQETWWLLWAWRNQNMENEIMYRSMPQIREKLGLTPARLSDGFDGELYNTDQRSISTLMEAMMWDWMFENDCNSVKWWNNGEAAMVPQAPHLWLVIDNISCASVITQTVSEPREVNLWVVASCAEGVASPGYTSALDLEITDSAESGYAPGDTVVYLSDNGTAYTGVVTAYVAAVDPATESALTVEFVDATVTCDTGGGSDAAFIRDAVNGG